MFADNFYGRSEPCEPTAPVKTEEPEASRKKKQMEGKLQIQCQGQHCASLTSPVYGGTERLWKPFSFFKSDVPEIHTQCSPYRNRSC